jgi:lipoprotein NlpI
MTNDGRRSEAPELAQEALELRTLAYGSYSPEVAWTYLWVGEVYLRAGDIASAHTLMSLAREVAERHRIVEVALLANRRLAKIQRLHDARLRDEK